MKRWISKSKRWLIKLLANMLGVDVFFKEKIIERYIDRTNLEKLKVDLRFSVDPDRHHYHRMKHPNDLETGYNEFIKDAGRAFADHLKRHRHLITCYKQKHPTRYYEEMYFIINFWLPLPGDDVYPRYIPIDGEEYKKQEAA